MQVCDSINYISLDCRLSSKTDLQYSKSNLWEFICRKSTRCNAENKGKVRPVQKMWSQSLNKNYSVLRSQQAKPPEGFCFQGAQRCFSLTETDDFCKAFPFFRKPLWLLSVTSFDPGLCGQHLRDVFSSSTTS